MSEIETESCNICCEPIFEDRKITLKCNPKHFFCYDCISDWYTTIKSNPPNSDTPAFTCPICKNDGGILPVMPPHTEKVIGIHKTYDNLTSEDISKLVDAIQMTQPTPCAQKNCLCIGWNKCYGMPDVLAGKKSHIYLCHDHRYHFKKGNPIQLYDNTTYISPYIRCSCLCKNVEHYNKIRRVEYMGKMYFLCKSHKMLYDNGVEISFNDGKKKKIYWVDGFHEKRICCMPNKSIIGFCTRKLVDGKCPITYHNDSDGGGAAAAKPICTALLKSGAPCKNKAKAGLDGMCGVHCKKA